MQACERLSPIRSQEEAIRGHVRREPFLDDQFLRFVATLPPVALPHGNFLRGLLRESMRGLLPDFVRLRETKGGLAPALLETMAPMGGFRVVEHLVDVRLMADLGLVEPGLFRARFNELGGRPVDGVWAGLV